MRSYEKNAVHVNRIQILALQRIHKGKFTGRELSSNPARGWIYMRETRKEKCWGRGWRTRGIAIGGHSSIRGINTLELMKAPREQQASGRNVNRDRPASDPFSCTANSQGPHLAPSLTPFILLCCPLHIPVPNSVFSTTHTVMPPATIPYVHLHVYFHLFLCDETNFLQCKT